ncbi:MAG: helix-turn-helix transcriptional regulator [Pseudolabrys sp.]|nr:helix-turn-helix transcriptional regulator [Pseudolabrys sp.]MDP2295881.1 helix-turn-helix transcriptional regulator [Pseudolabrys sp.]
MPHATPEYRKNMDDSPHQVAAMAKTWVLGEHIPLHMHRRGQLLHAVSGVMRVETAASAWIVPPARALWLPPELPHSVAMRSHRIEMRTIYIDPSQCAALPGKPVLVEISGLLRELILALLEEPADYDETGRGGTVARLILTELARLQERRLDVPMPRDPRALRVARALLDDSSIDRDLDQWAHHAGASRRTLARIFRNETGLSFAEWRARLRAIDGLARLSEGASVAETATSVGYASPSAFSAMIHRTLGSPPRRLTKAAAQS